jgi:hypothetical protein
MKRFGKSIIGIALALVMVSALLGATAFAAGGTVTVIVEVIDAPPGQPIPELFSTSVDIDDLDNATAYDALNVALEDYSGPAAADWNLTDYGYFLGGVQLGNNIYASFEVGHNYSDTPGESWYDGYDWTYYLNGMYGTISFDNQAVSDGDTLLVQYQFVHSEW